MKDWREIPRENLASVAAASGDAKDKLSADEFAAVAPSVVPLRLGVRFVIH